MNSLRLLVSAALLCIANASFAQGTFLDKSFLSGIFDLGSNHGVSFGDINNDGLEDVYVAVREEGVPNKLYLNKGDLVFEEIARDAGLADEGMSTAAVWGDINNDGWIDLYVGNSDSPNQLYLNRGDLSFENITIQAGVGDMLDPRSVQFVDYDNDGFLDIYLHNFNAENVLFKNNHDNSFSDVSANAGALNIDPAMGTIFFDIDGDGDQDLFALNDGGTNVLFENLGNGQFQDISEGSGLDIFCFCMGVDFSDYDQDGDYDLYISNYGRNFLFENNGDGTFTDQGAAFAVDDYGMGWGTFWFDFDNDGDQDIYLANHEYISSRPNMLYRNDGGSSFQQASENTVIESPYASFGTATADVNNDGQLDIVVANWGGTARNRLYVNEGQVNNAVLIKAIGTRSNASAIGATIKVRTGDKIQIDQVTAATGYASQNSLVQHFGIGELTSIDELQIIWPSGITESYFDLTANRYYTLTEEEGIAGRPLNNELVLSIEGGEPTDAIGYPNPFSQATFIPVDPKLVQPLLEVYTVNGDLVYSTSETIELDGKKGFHWYGHDQAGDLLGAGIYLFKIKSQKHHSAKGRLILNR